MISQTSPASAQSSASLPRSCRPMMASMIVKPNPGLPDRHRSTGLTEPQYRSAAGVVPFDR